MSTEQQARLRFLEEAETYFEQIEKVILNLNASEQRTQDLDVAMRAAHSVKGTAAMMDYTVLSHVAHHMEDYFKILRARNLALETDVETLLLQGLDSLREVRQRLYDERPVGEEWQTIYVEPIFDQLRQHLGELTLEDEDRILSAEDEVDVSVLVFTNGLEEYLDQLEAKRSSLSGESLRQELLAGANQLLEYGLMAEVDAFVSLCTMVLEYGAMVQAPDLERFAEQVIQTWKRSYSLVALGRMDQIPDTLPNVEAIAILPTADPGPQAHEGALQPQWDEGDPLGAVAHNDLSLDLARLEWAEDVAAFDTADVDAAVDAGVDPVEEEAIASDLSVSADDINNLQAQLAQLDLAEFSINEDDEEMDLADLDAADLEVIDLDNATLDDGALDESLNPPIGVPDVPRPDVYGAAAAAIRGTESPISPQLGTATPDYEVREQPQSALSRLFPALGAVSSTQPSTPMSRPLSETTVRVPVEQLQAINQLLGTLVLDHNAIALQFEQLQTFAQLLRRRVSSIETFNNQLRKWYDYSSATGLLSSASPNADTTQPSEGAQSTLLSASRLDTAGAPTETVFDALEMDQYSTLHLLAQENIESIVKLKEVSADIDLGVQAIDQVAGRLNYTSRSLQEQFNRAQMRPFEDIVGRFPRVIRDLSATHGKKVNLVIKGESTLFERYALEILTDPLIHLLRNAFDHGIEDPALRQAHGKPAEGTIQLKAMGRGNLAVITISDDGKGIDVDKIRDRVRQYGIPEDQIQQMSRKELLELIFEPGFTTTDKVTDLSGRGVGMDVVRSNLQEIKGNIQVDTQPGEGTTFTITIPLSLSLLRVMFLEHNSLVFALAAEDVKAMFPFDPEQLTTVQSQDYVPWDEIPIPLIRLERHWRFSSGVKAASMAGQPMIEHPLVVVVGDEERAYGLLLKRFWREQDVVIRSPSTPLPLSQEFSGTTVLGDGRVVPLMDPLRLREWVLESPTENPDDAESPPVLLDDHADAQSQIPTVLVVDDSVHARQYLALSLEKAGYVVEQAKDGSEAVDLLTAGLPVQAVICDVEMPRLDGYGVLDAVRQQPDLQSLPIMMLTSRSSEKHRKLAMNLGASAYFSKPYNEQELLQTLATLMDV